jgi:hypothetical protein
MILAPIEYDLANLLDSDDALAVCEIENEGLKHLVFLICEAGWGVILVETASGDHFVIARADGTQESNLVSDTRRWSEQYACQFVLKRSDQRIFTSREDVFVFPDGREVGIVTTYTVASGFTHWRQTGRETMPTGHVRL